MVAPSIVEVDAAGYPTAAVGMIAAHHLIVAKK